MQLSRIFGCSWSIQITDSDYLWIAVQGMGAAGIGSLSDIIVADLVPLKDRGNFMGILAAVWAIAAAIGPSIGKHVRPALLPHGKADFG